MIFRLFCLLVGYARITLDSRAEAAATLFLRKKINVAGQRREEKGGLSFIVPLYEKRKLLKLLAEYDFSVKSVEVGGLPPYLLQYRKRVGLLLGLCAAAAIITAGSLFLWQVRVVGCSVLSEEEVLALLAEEGVEVGGYIPPIDAKVVTREVLLKEPRIAYIAVNIIGTTCEVQVKEAVFPAEEKKESTPSSIVAAYDGLIERVEVYDGELCVKPGVAVRAGQVVISGLCQMEEGRWRLEQASGKVIARVEREFTVEVPLQEEVLRKSGEETLSRSLIFFKKSINLSKTSSILPPTYGTIISKDALTLPGGIVLPVALSTQRAVLYETVTLTRTHQEAEALALDRMEALVAKSLCDGEVLTLSQSVEHTEVGVRVRWQVYCLMDIAKSIPMVGLPGTQ